VKTVPDLRQVISEIQQPCARHPLMELCYYTVIHAEIIHNKAFDDLARSIPEQCRFYIVPLTRQGVKFIGFPPLEKYFILFIDMA
jgi:hypothetical protein